MRLLLVEPAPHGGLLHYIVQLGDALADRGHDVELLTARENELVTRARSARMRAELPRLVQGTDAAMSGLDYRLRQVRVAAQLGRCWTRILLAARRGSHDAIITGADIGVVPTAAAAVALTRVPGRPLLVRISHNGRTHNRWGGEDPYRSSRVLDALLARAVPRFDLTIHPGRRAEAEWRDRWPGALTAIVPHGDERLFAEQPPPQSGEERILFFGEWRKVKGLSVLMAAFDELATRRPGVRLTIAGTPIPTDTDPDVIRSWADRHGDRVEIIDRYVPIDDVAGIFTRARVVVTPYTAGNQSGVIALAMTMARAIVTTDVGELGTVVGDGRAGRVVPPGDPSALAEALENVVSNPGLAARYGSEGHRLGVGAAGWERGAELLETALYPLATRHRRR